MTVPMEYRTATEDFEAFLADLKEQAMLAAHNQAYALTRAVLHVFRGHLTVPEGLRFAQVLPPVLRAVFVEGWEPPRTRGRSRPGELAEVLPCGRRTIPRRQARSLTSRPPSAPCRYRRLRAALLPCRSRAGLLVHIERRALYAGAECR